MIAFDQNTGMVETTGQRLARMLDWVVAYVAEDYKHTAYPDPTGLDVAQDILTALRQEANRHDA